MMELILKLVLVLCVFYKNVHSQITTFSNPILDTPIRGASIIKVGEFYFLVHADNGNNELEILKSEFLSDFRWAEKEVIYKLPSGFDSFFPTAFLEYENDLYFYFHMSNHSVNSMYVLKAEDSKNPFGNWSAHVSIMDVVWNETAIHGAPFKLNNELYFVWTSPAENRTRWNLYIAKMEGPSKLVEPVVLLREPTENWECHVTCTVHAPSFVYNKDKLYMIFSASSSSAPETLLSYMSTQTGLDPLNTSSWVSAPGPVFQGCAEENLYSIRFPEFILSPDNSELWMTFAASADSANIDSSSHIRIENIEWDQVDGLPRFPAACGNGNQHELPSGEPFKFLNPIRNENAYDWNVLRVGDSYYISYAATSTEIHMVKSDKLYDFHNADRAVIYRAPAGYTIPLARRIQENNGEVYLYLTMQRNNEVRQIYVMKAGNTSNLLQGWGTPTRILNGLFDEYAFQGTAMHYGDQMYFVWCNTKSGAGITIYIAPMRSPTEATGPVVLLKKATEPWECRGSCSNHYPAFLYRNNTAYLIFSAGSLGNPDCSLSYMSIEFGKDPLNVTNWHIAPEPVFTRNDAENVYATCHASFTTSKDGSETWMAYQASNTAADVVAHLKPRIEKIDWDDETGLPVFPKAHGFSHPQSIPGSAK